MATYSSEEDVKRQAIVSMGEDFGTLHFHLWHEVAWLHLKWQDFRELFAGDQSRFDIMNETAPNFFSHLEQIFWQDILLSISRLSDPPSTRGQANLTLRQYTSRISDPSLLAEVNSALDDVDAKTRFARDWRHRRFAHRDLHHTVSPLDQPLQHASRANVEAALSNRGDR